MAHSERVGLCPGGDEWYAQTVNVIILLNEYLHRYRARWGRMPIAMPVTFGEAMALLKYAGLEEGFRCDVDPAGYCLMGDRVMDFKGVELFVQANARSDRYCHYPAPPC